jgi:hypothetical protein
VKSCDFAFGSCGGFSVEEACELLDENGLSDDSFIVSDLIRAVEIHRACCQCRDCPRSKPPAVRCKLWNPEVHRLDRKPAAQPRTVYPRRFRACGSRPASAPARSTPGTSPACPPGAAVAAAVRRRNWGRCRPGGHRRRRRRTCTRRCRCAPGTTAAAGRRRSIRSWVGAGAWRVLEVGLRAA